MPRPSPRRSFRIRRRSIRRRSRGSSLGGTRRRGRPGTPRRRRCRRPCLPGRPRVPVPRPKRSDGCSMMVSGAASPARPTLRVSTRSAEHASSRCSLRPTSRTFVPARCLSRAISAPMPELAPVTTATLPSTVEAGADCMRCALSVGGCVMVRPVDDQAGQAFPLRSSRGSGDHRRRARMIALSVRSGCFPWPGFGVRDVPLFRVECELRAFLVSAEEAVQVAGDVAPGRQVRVRGDEQMPGRRRRVPAVRPSAAPLCPRRFR